jgi:hypothetical protein
MDYKLLALDLDGTLLSGKHEIDKETIRHIKFAEEKGVKVIIATGRLYASAKYFGRMIDIKTSIISCNGAYVKAIDTEDVIGSHPFKKEDIEALVEIYNRYPDAYYQVYSDKGMYSKELKYSSLQYSLWNKQQKEEDRIPVKILERPEDLLEIDEPLYKIYSVAEAQSEEMHNEYIRAVHENTSLYSVQSMKGTMDILRKGINKGIALEKLADYYHVSLDEVIAVGDNHNDIDMIKYAGMGIAMGNAENEVKDVAQYITSTNTDGGIVKVIGEYIL